MPDIMTIYGSVFYLSRGEGTPPIIAIHGAGGVGRYWGNQVASLGNVTQLVTFDLPGHGRSTGPTHTSIDEGAQRVTALMNVLGMQRAILMGHSMGGAIALWLALHQPDRVAGLVLVGTGGRLRVHPDIVNGLRTDWEATTRLITEWHYAPATSPLIIDAGTADLRQTDPSIMLSDYEACNQFDIMDRIGNIPAPALIVVGEHDRLTPPKYAEFLAQQLPNAKLQVIPQAGHMVMIEQPNAVNAAVAAFVEEVRQHTP